MWSSTSDGPQILGCLGPSDESNSNHHMVEIPTIVNHLNKDIPMEHDVFCDPTKPPSNFNLPPNFNWVYIHGIWTLSPRKFSKDLQVRSSQDEGKTQMENMEIWSGENQIQALPPDNGHHDMGGSGQEVDSSDSQAT